MICILSNIFNNNSAFQSGGALHFQKILSDMSFLLNNEYLYNSAPYGNDYSSYPSTLFSQEIFIDAYPGIKIDDFNISIIDHFDQIIDTENGL